MKLSTFAKKVKQAYIKNTFESPHLCTNITRVTIALGKKANYKIALYNQYREFEEKCLEFISSSIGNNQIVHQYMRAQNLEITEETVHAFRLNLLNDMIDWAEAQEQSHQL